MNIPQKDPSALKEIFIAQADSEDERLWVPSAEGIAFRPLFLSVSQGYWMTLARIRRSGVVSRHSHPQPVHGYVIKGKWRYLEHDWIAEAGSYIYEPPGDTHTLVVDASSGEMLTLFQVHGSMIYLDENGGLQGYDDVFTRVAQCRRHFESVGLGGSYVDRFIR